MLIHHIQHTSVLECLQMKLCSYKYDQSLKHKLPYNARHGKQKEKKNRQDSHIK